MEKNFSKLVIQLGQLLVTARRQLCVAESCTGGWVSQALTTVPGSSVWFERGFVTYTNIAKQEMLGVEEKTLATYGAVSEQTAIAMAEGALRHSHAQISLAITGIAGPGGGTPEKPVGLVCFAWSGDNFPTKALAKQFQGDRTAIRAQAVEFALTELLRILE